MVAFGFGGWCQLRMAEKLGVKLTKSPTLTTILHRIAKTMDQDVDMTDAPCATTHNNNDATCPEGGEQGNGDVGYISDDSSFYGRLRLHCAESPCLPKYVSASH